MALENLKKIEFTINGRQSFIICPERPLEGNPWIWKTEFFYAFNFAERALVEKGFYLAYHCVSDMYGAPESIDMMKEFYDLVTTQYGLSKTPALFGFSRGGLYACNFALKHPDCISMLYLDAPVLDVASWPGGKYIGLGDADCWTECKEIYGITEKNWCDFKGNPLDNAEALAELNIPILLICGAMDRYVPYHENGEPFFNRVKAAGGKISRIIKPYCDHHPHGLYDTTIVCDFVLCAFGLKDEKSFNHRELSYNGAKTVVFGDSITRGTYTAVGDTAPTCVADKRWINYLCDHFGLNLVGDYAINGVSISEKTTVQPELSLVHRFENAKDADLIFVAMGTNDFGTNVPLGSPSDNTDVSFYGALDVVCRGFKKIRENRAVIFITPIRRFDEKSNEIGKSLNDYRVAIKEVAYYRYGFKVINGENIGFDPADKEIKNKYMFDGVHPSPEIQKMYGEYIISELEKGSI